MTDISVSTVATQVEKRSWLLSAHGTDPGTNPSITLDVSAFTAGTHYPNGYIPSGTNLGRITASGLYGPYDNAAADGRQDFAGHLFSSLKVPNTSDTTKDVGGALLVHGFVKLGKLPFALDAAGQADAAGRIHYTA